MHPEVVSDKPGNCPKCGMTLEPMMPRPSETRTIYTCPMHPEIEQDHPGQCPKCGMTLEPKTVGGVDEQEQRAIRSLSVKFWVGLALTIPVLILAMGKYIPALNLHTLIPMAVSSGWSLSSARP
jgi:Cu+-exporting ATPase